jgi:triacylglycerol lipase
MIDQQTVVDALAKFNPKTTAFNLNNALAMAYLSNEAYGTGETIHKNLEACGYRVFVIVQGDVQAVVAGNKDSIIVAFRGTRPDQLSDWMTDFNINQRQFDPVNVPGACVHNGFYTGLVGVWDTLYDCIVKCQTDAQTVWITGHSLGGALAVLCCAFLTFIKREPVNGLYTFGQPRVGDINFCTICDAHFGNVHFRFVNNEDIVTRVPPRIILAPPMMYGHSGAVRFFDASGALHADEHWWNEFLIRIDVGPDMLTLLKLPVTDHDLVNGYITNIIKNYISDIIKNALP